MSPDKRDIVVYGAPWCGDCRTSKAVLEKHNILFLYRDIEVDAQAQREFLEMVGDGPRSIPRILFRQRDESTEEMEIIDTLVEPTPVALIGALKTHGYISVEGK